MTSSRVSGPQLHGDSVTGAKIADGSVAAPDVAPDSLGVGQVDEASLDPSVLQRRLRAVAPRAGNFVATGITGTLSAGSHVIDLSCFEEDGRINVEDTRITAVTLD